MLTFYTVVFLALVGETAAVLLGGLSAAIDRSVSRRQARLDREGMISHLKRFLRVALRFGFGILLAVRIVQLTG